MVSGANALPAENDAAGWKVRTWHDRNEVVDRKCRIVDQCGTGIDDLAEIVRGNVGRHADRNAAGAIDQKIRKTRRQDQRLPFGAVVIDLKIDGVFVEVRDQGAGDALE